MRTWDDLAECFGLPDFTPASQDLGAIHLIRQCKALALIHEGRIRDPFHACRKNVHTFGNSILKFWPYRCRSC